MLHSTAERGREIINATKVFVAARWHFARHASQEPDFFRPKLKDIFQVADYGFKLATWLVLLTFFAWLSKTTQYFLFGLFGFCLMCLWIVLFMAVILSIFEFLLERAMRFKMPPWIHRITYIVGITGFFLLMVNWGTDYLLKAFAAAYHVIHQGAG